MLCIFTGCLPVALVGTDQVSSVGKFTAVSVSGSVFTALVDSRAVFSLTSVAVGSFFTAGSFWAVFCFLHIFGFCFCFLLF